MEGRCHIGSKRGGQQSPQQLRGLHGNLATDHLQAPITTTLNVLWKLYLPVILTWDGRGGEGGGGLEGKQNVLVKQTSAERKAPAPLEPPTFSETADQHWLDFNFA